MRTTVLWAAATLLLVSACARHSPPATSVGSSGTAVETAEPVEELRAPALDEYVRQVQDLSRGARPKEIRTASTTVEATNRDLAAALAALAISPSAARHIAVAAAYVKAGIRDKGHEHLSAAASIDRRSATAYDGMARIWRDWGFPNVGLADAHRAVYYAPRSPEAHNTLGTVLQALGFVRRARTEYERSLALNPRAAYALNNLCSLDLLEGNATAAVKHCERALTLEPTLTVATCNLEHARAILRAVAAETR